MIEWMHLRQWDVTPVRVDLIVDLPSDLPEDLVFITIDPGSFQGCGANRVVVLGDLGLATLIDWIAFREVNAVSDYHLCPEVLALLWNLSLRALKVIFLKGHRLDRLPFDGLV